MADTALNLIGARDSILIEGRFADSDVFVGGLAALRPRELVFICKETDHRDVSFGTLRTRAPLQVLKPLDIDLTAYAARLRREASGAEAAT